MKLLIVDDEKHVVHGLLQMVPWKELGFTDVETAYDGEEAWGKVVKDRPDLLITDIYMPNMNGLELIQRVRERDREMPVIILSGYDHFEYAKEAIHLGVSKYILKPAVYTEIMDVVKDCLREMEAEARQKRYMTEFMQQVNENLPILRKQFLFDMITFGLRRKDVTPNRLAFYELDESIMNGGLVMSLLIHRSPSAKTRSERDWQLLKFAVNNIAHELAVSDGAAYVLRYMEERLPLLLFGTDKHAVVNRAKALAQQLISSIGQYLDLDANVGIGRWYGDMEQYPLSEQESREMLMLSEYEGHQRIFYVEDELLYHPGQRWPDYPADQVQKMFPAFLRLDRKQVHEQWRKIESRLLEASDAPISYLQSVLIGILNSLYLYLAERDPCIVEGIDALLSLQTLHHLHSREQLMKWMRERLDAFLDHLECPAATGGGKGYVEYVKKVVRERYHENISFSEIARELHLTRNYLSYLFKRETGQSFMNYLTGYRINKAKELMDTNRYMIYEICEMVGYSDPAYFSRMFKNFTGMSPSEYMLRTRSER